MNKVDMIYKLIKENPYSNEYKNQVIENYLIQEEFKKCLNEKQKTKFDKCFYSYYELLDYAQYETIKKVLRVLKDMKDLLNTL